MGIKSTLFGIVSNAGPTWWGRDSKHRDCSSTPNVSHLPSGDRNGRSPAAATRVIRVSSLPAETTQKSSQLEGLTRSWIIATVMKHQASHIDLLPNMGSHPDQSLLARLPAGLF